MIFASKKKKKIKEIKSILKDYEIKSLKEEGICIDISEDKDTFYENALSKAREIYKITNKPALADDSGLCIKDLNDWPGVNTRRFLGPNKTDRERNLAIIDKVNSNALSRNAEVVCVLVYYDGKEIITAEGRIEGKITRAPKGENGFGFDEIFEYNSSSSSFEKTQDRVSEIIPLHSWLYNKTIKKLFNYSGKQSYTLIDH